MTPIDCATAPAPARPTAPGAAATLGVAVIVLRRKRRA